MAKLIKYISAAAILSLTLASCSEDRYIINQDGEPIASRNSVRAQIANAHEIGDEMLYNIRPYIFNGENNALRGDFYGVPNTVIFPGHYIDMSMRPGTWDLTLVTGPNRFWQTLAQSIPGVTDIQDVLEQPSHGKNASEARMYRHRAVNGILPDFKDFYTALVKDVVVDNNPEGKVNEFTSPVYFLRNFCKVRIILETGQELKLGENLQAAWLSNIPEALDWNGGLYPSPERPDVSSSPMATKYFETVHSHVVTGSDGTQKNVIKSTNELVYYIPAHRGVDADTDNPVDTATHQININFAFTAEDDTPVSKTDVPVTLTPRPNTELVIKVHYEKRQLGVYTEILPWTEHQALDAHVGAQHVKVDKTTIGLAWKDTLHVECDADYTVTRAADCNWLTINKLSDGVFELVANVDTYTPGQPRSSFVNVTCGNYTKRIPVTQRPENVGSIKVHVTGQPDVKQFWLSPPHNTKNVTVECFGGDWKTLPSVALSQVKTGPEGVTDNVAVTRNIDNNIFYDEYDEAFGLQNIVFFNKKTLDTDTIVVDNLFIGADDDVLEIEQPTSGTLQVVTSHVLVYGGRKDVQIISYPTSFIRSVTYNLATQQFTFQSLSNANGDDQWGDIVLAHKDDPDYRVTIPIDQSIRVDIPEFDFFVVKFTWPSADVDIQCGFYNNPATVNYRDVVYNTTLSNTINNRYVGYGRNGAPSIGGAAVLTWGGDATGGQGETVFFNAKNMNKFPYPGGKDENGVRATPTTPNMLPRVVRFLCAAGWYSTQSANTAVACQVICYLGGTMQQSGTNFNNSGGSQVFYQTRTYSFSSTKAKYPNYVKFCDIDYDRKKHTASVTWDGNTVVS